MDDSTTTTPRATTHTPTTAVHPSRASLPLHTTLLSADPRSASLPAKSTPSVKRKTPQFYTSGPHISLARAYYLSATQSRKRSRMSTSTALHQSTCLHIASADSVESDLWILPDFDEWEFDAGESAGREDDDDGGGGDAQGGRAWAPLVSRAVVSNRERLRQRLEGDGWAFVGGKYGDGDADGGMDVLAGLDSGSEESVDEEFDVVVLPMVQVSC
ncbi:hypothetical protein BDV95DRAFT_589837 [Massariosphaeria phaeospora]|uniref:Uncharacterized protein n=1 Tax=Massariosphaeria phaeospora TaxID=100035 RepID=A0A7C8IGR6_9PLEO|nr:hypothetical protein BDV95DRAFT_589837 [Massariosphaeria phaeospora]